LKIRDKNILFRALREKDDVQSRVRTISVLAVLLQGPFDTGNAILGSQNLVNLMIQMAGSDDPVQQVKFRKKNIYFHKLIRSELAYCNRSNCFISFKKR